MFLVGALRGLGCDISGGGSGVSGLGFRGLWGLGFKGLGFRV